MEHLQDQYCSLDMHQRKEFFYNARDQFNNLRLSWSVDNNRGLMLAALFVFLNKTCFRGVFRVNRQNELVAAFGYLKQQPKIVNAELINRLHQLFTEYNVQFYCCSYDELDLGNERMLLYLDPPYYKTFDKYTADGFDQNAFVEYLETVTNKPNCKVILSNSNDFEEVIASNELINLHTIYKVSVKDLTNTTTPPKDRVEIIGINL